MKVRFNDLALINEPYLPVWEPKFREIVRNSQFILGPDVKSFEANFAKYIGVNHCIGVNNGTSALTIALQVLKIKNPDMKFVAVPAMTFAASIEAVHMAQLVPVLVDITSSGGMDFEQLKKIRELQKIDAVIVVHLCGTAVEIPELDIPVIEDNCQGVGSYFKDGARTGSKGILSAVSFYSGKNLGALGDGGAICTSDPELDSLCRMLRNHGSKEKYVHEYVGMTARLDNLQAAFLDIKLPNLDQENEQRRQVASWYYEQLLTSDVRNYIEFQTKEPTKKNNFHLFVIKTPLRDELAKFLNDSGIETVLHYPVSLNNMQANKGKILFLNEGLINAEKWANQCLSLPMHPYLTFEEVTFVCSKIKEFFKNLQKDSPNKNKRMAVLPLMGPDEYLEFAIDSFIDEVDYLLFSVNTRSWGNADIKLTSESKKYIEDLVKTNPKFRLMTGTWGKERGQHNAATEYAISLGCSLILCASTDMVYGQGAAKRILDTLEYAKADMLTSEWENFWKKKPLYVIRPVDPHEPILAIKTNVRYNGISGAIGLAVKSNLDYVKVFHFSFARDDEFIKHKIGISSHADDVKSDWYENVWKNFKPGDTNLSPFQPEFFKTAEEYPLENLPPKLRDYFQKIKDKV